MVYPAALFSTFFSFLKKCPHCGKSQMIKRDQRRPLCKKCGRAMTVQIKKGKSL